MKIPFGKRAPNEGENDLLATMGFDLKAISQYGKNFYLKVPKNSMLEVAMYQFGFDRQGYTVKFNGLEVITINQKTISHHTFIAFHINITNLEQAQRKLVILAGKCHLS
jgi:hypothetical protein